MRFLLLFSSSSEAGARGEQTGISGGQTGRGAAGGTESPKCRGSAFEEGGSYDAVVVAIESLLLVLGGDGDAIGIILVFFGLGFGLAFAFAFLWGRLLANFLFGAAGGGDGRSLARDHFGRLGSAKAELALNLAKTDLRGYEYVFLARAEWTYKGKRKRNDSG